MKKISTGQKRLLAEFSTNIGVAWFAGSVVGTFVAFPVSSERTFITIVVGLLFSLVFLSIGFFTLKGAR